MRKRKNYGLWATHRGYRKSVGRPLALDLVTGKFERMVIYPWYRYTPKELVAAAVYRYMRIYKKTSIRDWNSAVESFAKRISGNPRATANSLLIEYVPANRQGRPVRFNLGDDGTCLDASDKNRRRRLQADKRLRSYVENKKTLDQRSKYLSERTCQACGVFDEKGPRPTGVYYRYLTINSRRAEDRVFGWGKLLCVACWNRAKPIVRRANEANELRLLINRKTKEIRNVRNKHHKQDSSSTHGGS